MPLLRDCVADLASSYLIAHADNPVDWWTWGEDALGEATRRDCPIFLSVGYAACHWCHVMAHESFEDPEIAALLNENFVAVKVDREERPDLDQLYMAATQLISGHGGWPMSVFLLPDGRPFTAGTYYPPIDRHGQVGFATLLRAIGDAWRTRRREVQDQANALETSLAREVAFVEHLAPRTSSLDLTASRALLARDIASDTDENGGSSAPRFPRPSYVNALLDVGDGPSRAAATRILRAMSRGGLFDHLVGGFARYSVDQYWRVPHFEKMLSDQALLARAYFRAARVAGLSREDDEYEQVARRTVAFVMTALEVPEGFASSLDADAAGREGSHVTWTPEEVRSVLREAGLGEMAEATMTYLSISTPGDLEGRSVPRLGDASPFTALHALDGPLDALRRARERRPQPARDEKVILEWNAMFASALFASRDATLAARAQALLEGLGVSHLRRGHWWRTESARDYATAADLAWLVDAHVDAFEESGEDRWLDAGYDVARYLIEHFWDGPVPSSRSPHEGQGLFSTSDQCSDLFVRPKEIFDAATPSSHAVATRSLARLALCRGDQDLMSVAARLVALGAELIATHPRAVIDLVEAAGFVTGVEVVIPGGPNPLSEHVRSLPMLRGVLITGAGTSALLAGRHAGLAYVCHGGTCQRPVASVEELDELLAGAF
jgi:uncharacterized protein YyaL (SSP411 family)